jgi:hypothetical protein
MTTEQALQLIDQVCSRFVGTREDHVNIQLALNILRSSQLKEEEKSALPQEDVTTLSKPKKKENEYFRTEV